MDAPPSTGSTAPVTNFAAGYETGLHSNDN